MLPNAEAVKGRAERAAKAAIITELSDDFGPVSLLAAILWDKGILNVSGLFALSQMDKKVFEENLGLLSIAAEQYGLLEFGSSRNFISADAFDRALHGVLRILQDFHAKYPERAGIDAEKLHASLGDGAAKITSGDFKELLRLMAAKNSIVSVAAQGKIYYRMAGYSESLDKKLMELVERIREESGGALFNLVKLSELEEKLKASPSYMKRALVFLRERDDLRVLEGGLLFPRKTREQLLRVLASMDGDITVASLRDAIGVNRKYSLAMLDFLDAQGLTQRVGDKRILKS
ncbi:hypothetical protein Holit_01014 [Hollandina sp. SP2]